MKKTQQKGTEVPLVLLDDLTRPVPDLIAEMAEAAERFEQVAMILARTESDTVHFIWHHPDCRALVAEVEALVSDGCVPVGLLAIRETPEGWRTFAKSFAEHAFRPGIESYLRGIMQKMLEAYDSPTGSKVSH